MEFAMKKLLVPGIGVLGVGCWMIGIGFPTPDT
jgi:hypothetical protein